MSFLFPGVKANCAHHQQNSYLCYEVCMSTAYAKDNGIGVYAGAIIPITQAGYLLVKISGI
jgi:hypothetical protein